MLALKSMWMGHTRVQEDCALLLLAQNLSAEATETEDHVSFGMVLVVYRDPRGGSQIGQMDLTS